MPYFAAIFAIVSPLLTIYVPEPAGMLVVAAVGAAGLEGVFGAAGAVVVVPSEVVAAETASVSGDNAGATTKEVSTNSRTKECAMIFFKVGTSFFSLGFTKPLA
jgi:hypothetical protein